MNAGVEELLDRDITAPFSDAEVDLLRAADLPQLPTTLRRLAERLEEPGWEPLPELAFFLVRFKSRPEDPVTPDQLQLDGCLVRLLPRSTAYYRDRAERARRPRQLLSTDVQR
jgi:hypothetical protein